MVEGAEHAKLTEPRTWNKLPRTDVPGVALRGAVLSPEKLIAKFETERARLPCLISEHRVQQAVASWGVVFQHPPRPNPDGRLQLVDRRRSSTSPPLLASKN